MKLTNIRLAGFVLFGLAIWAVGQNVRADDWKPVSNTDTWQSAPATESTSTTLNWQQRVLKKPVVQEEPAAKKPAESLPSEQSYRSARRTSYESEMFGPPQMPRAPGYSSNRHRARLVSNEQMEVIPPGTTQYEPIAEEGSFAGEAPGGCSSCGGGECDSCGGPSCGETCDFGYECFDGRCGWWIKNLTVFAGGEGFKGPVDWGTNGNFGFNEGLGISGPLGDPWGCGYQMGVRFAQSNFGGLQASAPGTDRTQYFVTAGIFRRQLCRGLQWGVVWDYMHDRYYDTFDLNQIRTDIGYVINDCNEIGFMGAFGLNTDTYDFGNFRNIRLDPTDMFAFYFRRNFEGGGEGRVWGGGTGRGDGLVGADLWVPLGRGFALNNIVNYKIPQGGRANGVAHADESWGASIQLIWYPGKTALCQRSNPYRPMENIADNGLFMVDQLTH